MELFQSSPPREQNLPATSSVKDEWRQVSLMAISPSLLLTISPLVSHQNNNKDTRVISVPVPQ